LIGGSKAYVLKKSLVAVLSQPIPAHCRSAECGFDVRALTAFERNTTPFGGVSAVLAWSFTTLPVAAKYQMTSVPDFLKLETAFTVIQFAIVAPLIALAYRGAPVSMSINAQGVGESPRAS
jgi:hypothetical protein